MEWTENLSQTLCPDDAHHRWEVPLCRKYDNPDYRARLEYSLANQLFATCNHDCVYDYTSYNTDEPIAFMYTTYNCYRPVWDYLCFYRDSAEWETVNAYMDTICEAEESCRDIETWSPVKAYANCRNSYQGGGDAGGNKGWITARICKGTVTQGWDGETVDAQESYDKTFKLALANHVFWSCSSWCVFDPQFPIAYEWQSLPECWEAHQEGGCFTKDLREYEWAREYIDSLCELATKDFQCINPMEDWTDEVAGLYCSTTGVTDKTTAAMVCDGYESYQTRLDLSLANRLHMDCHGWCVCDISTDAETGFSWQNTAGCWKPIPRCDCFTNSEYETYLEDFVKHTFCELQIPTPKPTTCMPYHIWDEERSTQMCPDLITDSNAPDRSYGASVCADDESSWRQSDLEKSLANGLYKNCWSWCTYDYDTILNNVLANSDNHGGFRWKDADLCWKWVTQYSCFGSSIVQYNIVMEFAITLCAAI